MIKNTTPYTGLLLGLGLLAAGPAWATNITIADNQPINWGFTGNSGGAPLTAGGFGQAREDNEVETHKSATKLTSSYTNAPGDGFWYLNITRSQAWDIEGLYLSGNTLSIVGGYDFLNGASGGRPGDLFIKVGGGQPGTGPVGLNTPSPISNSMGYNYAVDLSVSTWTGAGTYVNAASFGVSRPWYTLNANSMLRSVINDQVGSNPWGYDSNQPAGGISVSYLTGAAGLAAGSILDNTLIGTFRNVLVLDLTPILSQANPGDDIWFSYTMECGNDSVKGHTRAPRVPDGGETTILVGFALAALGLGRRFFRRAA